MAGVEHGQHLIPLSDLYRALDRPRHRRHRRLSFTRGHEIAGSRLRHDQLLLFQRLVGLLNGADADAVFLAQAAYRRQLFAGAIQPLSAALCQQAGQMLIAGYAVSLIVAIQINKPVQIGGKNEVCCTF